MLPDFNFTWSQIQTHLEINLKTKLPKHPLSAHLKSCLLKGHNGQINWEISGKLDGCNPVLLNHDCFHVDDPNRFIRNYYKNEINLIINKFTIHLIEDTCGKIID